MFVFWYWCLHIFLNFNSVSFEVKTLVMFFSVGMTNDIGFVYLKFGKKVQNL